MNERVTNAFDIAKNILSEATLLVHYDDTAKLEVMVNSSDTAKGGFVQQYNDNI